MTVKSIKIQSCNYTKEDNKMQLQKKYLIIVPHPDDEINIAGQLICQLTQTNNEVHVLFTTNGDYYIYEGERRLKEAINALRVLGVDEKNIIFMGYGDDWKGKKHIYNAKDETAIESMGGRRQTYGLKTHPEYRFTKSGCHYEYTRKNYKQDMMDVILDLLADVLVVVDFDWHPDHRCTSLMFEEVMGDILKAKNDYKPVVLKKFAYGGVWNGPKDYYKIPGKATCLPSKELVNDARFETDVPAYTWADRIRFEPSAETQTLMIKKNIIYKSAKEHRTQSARFRIDRICNADIVYWLRKTNSLSYQAKIQASSGDCTFLNDFKLIDCPDVNTQQKGIGIFGDCVWTPDKTDPLKTVTFFFYNPVSVSCLSFYENFSLEDHIQNGIIQFDNGFRVETGPLNHCGSETVVEFSTQYNIKSLSFQITESIGDCAGLTELEIYEKRENPDLSYIARTYSSDRNTDAEIDVGYYAAAFLEQCSLETARFFMRLKRKMIRGLILKNKDTHVKSLPTAQLRRTENKNT